MQMIKKSRVYGLVVWLYISGFEGSVDAVFDGLLPNWWSLAEIFIGDSIRTGVKVKYHLYK